MFPRACGSISSRLRVLRKEHSAAKALPLLKNFGKLRHHLLGMIFVVARNQHHSLAVPRLRLAAQHRHRQRQKKKEHPLSHPKILTDRLIQCFDDLFFAT